MNQFVIRALNATEYLQFHDGQFTSIDAGKTIYIRAVEACLAQSYQGGVISYKLEERDNEIYFQEVNCLADSPRENIYSLSVQKIIFALSALSQTHNNGADSKVEGFGIQDKHLSQYFNISAYFLDQNKDKIWVDLFKLDFYDLDLNSDHLSNLIYTYHLIKKTDPNLFPERRRYLKNIYQLSKADPNFSNNSTLQLIAQTAINKSRYLFQLEMDARLESKRHRYLLPAKDAETVDSNGSKKLSRRGGSKTRTFYNSYPRDIVSHLDPGHRESIGLLYDCYQSFNETKLDTSDPLSFFYWLEGQSLTGKESELLSERYRFPEKRRVVFDANGNALIQDYYGDTSAEPTLINGASYYPILSDSKSTDRNLYPSQTVNNRYLYNIDVKGDLYVLLFDGHDSVNQGRQAITAGMIEFLEGKILYMDRNSGHYKPEESNLKRGIEKLTNKYGRNIFHPHFTTSGYHDIHFLDFEQILSLDVSTLSSSQRNEKVILDRLRNVKLSIIEFREQEPSLLEGHFILNLIRELNDIYSRLYDETEIKLTESTQDLLKIETLKKFNSSTVGPILESEIDTARIAIKSLLGSQQNTFTSHDIQVSAIILFELGRFKDTFGTVRDLNSTSNPPIKTVFKILYEIMKHFKNLDTLFNSLSDEKLKSAMKHLVSDRPSLPFNSSHFDSDLFNGRGIESSATRLKKLSQFAQLPESSIHLEIEGKIWSLLELEDYVSSLESRSTAIYEQLRGELYIWYATL